MIAAILLLFDMYKIGLHRGIARHGRHGPWRRSGSTGFRPVARSKGRILKVLITKGRLWQLLWLLLYSGLLSPRGRATVLFGGRHGKMILWIVKRGGIGERIVYWLRCRGQSSFFVLLLLPRIVGGGGASTKGGLKIGKGGNLGRMLLFRCMVLLLLTTAAELRNLSRMFSGSMKATARTCDTHAPSATSWTVVFSIL